MKFMIIGLLSVILYML